MEVVQFENLIHSSYPISWDNVPATQAVKSAATFPPINELKTTFDMSFPLSGQIAVNPPRVTPIEAKFAKQHNAYVAIVVLRG